MTSIVNANITQGTREPMLMTIKDPIYDLSQKQISIEGSTAKRGVEMITAISNGSIDKASGGLNSKQTTFRFSTAE